MTQYPIPDELRRFYQARNAGRHLRAAQAPKDEPSLLSGLISKLLPASQPVAPPAKPTRPQIPKKLRYEILKRDQGKCRLCGASSKDGATLHVDHIKPVSQGGETTKANLQTLCQDCNLGKGNRDQRRW